MNIKKIVHIGHVPCPLDHPDFSKLWANAKYPGRWVLNLAKAQKNHASYNVEIAIKAPGAKQNWVTEIEGVSCHFVAMPNLLRGKTFFYFDQRILADYVKKMQPEIVHAHGTEESNALAALRIDVPNILSVQGCFFIINRFFPPRFYSRQWIVERLEKKTIPKFEHIIAKSVYIKNELVKEFPLIRPQLIPNTYDSSLELLGIQVERRFSIVYVGTLSPWKGLDYLCDAIENINNKFPDITLDICGDKPDSLDEYEIGIKNRLKHLLGSRLFLHGILSNFEAVKIVASCRLLMAPSIKDMFGNQAVEALLVGTPVLTLGGTAIAENVERFGNGVVASVESLSQDLEAMLNKSYDIESAVLSRQKVLDYMGPMRVAQKHFDIYEESLNSKI